MGPNGPKNGSDKKTFGEKIFFFKITQNHSIRESKVKKVEKDEQNFFFSFPIVRFWHLVIFEAENQLFRYVVSYVVLGAESKYELDFMILLSFSRQLGLFRPILGKERAKKALNDPKINFFQIYARHMFLDAHEKLII